ncbi:hypothetical protein JTE90_024702 [Oedothorax gibbosus]|uniref:Uncharacterized protein n=1 Tax=Oedothorax gibbosus TaxID=931172 RepID=A0AAV6UAR1_9ARAC|nr:hypothetical protein JTE90_024702 [Oedothorax gibbosus]
MPSMTEDETVKLDKLKGERSQLRRVFTNAARRFSDVLESTDIQTKDISSDFNKVIEKAERLFKVDEEIKAVTFEYTDEEFDIIESYRDKLTEIKSKYSKHLQEDFKHPEDDVRSTSSKPTRRVIPIAAIWKNRGKLKKHQEEQAAELEEKRIVAKGTARKKETIHSMESKAKVLTEVHKEMKTSADAMLKEANERLKKAIKKNDPIEIKKKSQGNIIHKSTTCSNDLGETDLPSTP